MASDEVVSLIGRPDRVNPSQTVSGRQEQWIYRETTVVANVRGQGAGVGYAFLMGLNDRKEGQISLYFENGILTSSQGF